jgi:hypothetical protein
MLDYARVFEDGHPLYGPNWTDKYLEAWALFGEPPAATRYTTRLSCGHWLVH